MTFTYDGLGSIALPENVGWETEPVSVACDPVNAGIELVPAGVKAAVPFVPAGVNAAVLLVPEGVKAAVLFVPVAVVVCVCPARAEPVKVSAPTVVDDPVKVSAGTVRFGAVALHAVVEPVPAAMLVAAQLPLVAVAPLEPRGVIDTVAFVPAGVPALTELEVTEFPVNV